MARTAPSTSWYLRPLPSPDQARKSATVIAGGVLRSASGIAFAPWHSSFPRRRESMHLSAPARPGGLGPRLRGDDASPPHSIALHAARVGGGFAADAVLGGGAEAALGPIRADFHLVAAAFQLLDGGLGQAAFHHQYAGSCSARPEGEREVLDVPGRRVDRLLQVHLRLGAVLAGVTQEELAAPLVLLIAAGRAPAHVGLAVAEGHADRERGARAFSRSQRAGQTLLEPEHLPARAERPAERRDHRRGLQPAARGRRGEHVAGLVDDVDVHGVADHLAARRHLLL